MIRAGISHCLLTTLVLMYSQELKVFFNGIIQYINTSLFEQFLDLGIGVINEQLVFVVAVAIVFFSWGALFHNCAYGRRKHG